MGILKYIIHPSRIIKIVEWAQMKRKFKSVGENCKIGLNFSIVGPEDITIGNNFVGGDNISLWAWESYNGRKRILIEKIYKVTSKIVLVQVLLSIIFFLILK